MPILPSAAVPPRESAPLAMTSANLCRSYFPGRGLGYSLFVHVIAFTLLLLFPVIHRPTERLRLPPQATTPNRSEDIVMVYVPSIGGGVQGLGDESKSSGSKPTVDPSSDPEGLIYPGPEPVRSDTPQPSNDLQALLHLELEPLPILHRPLDFLNLFLVPETVKPKEQQPLDPFDVAANELIQPELEDVPIPTPSLDFLNLLPMPEIILVQQVELPELPVALPDTLKPEEQEPVDPSDGMATEPIPLVLEPQPPATIRASKPLVPTRVPSRKRDLRSILALTPLPTWRGQPIQIPAGDVRGRFTISPEPNLDTSETEPGSRVDGEGDSSRTGLAGITIVGGVGGIQTSDWGADSSPSRALAGITILGGVGGTGASVNSVSDSQIPRPVQAKYGVFVVSTEDSGGGLPYFGVFSNAQINTVYLDMRQNETDAAPFWTLEFAVPGGIAIQANPPGELDEDHEGLVLPVPVVKEQPELPLELVSRYIGKMIIVYAVVNTEGKMEQISVKESPDPVLNQPVLDALTKWVFRPGVFSGDPVAVKALLGIPLWPVPALSS